MPETATRDPAEESRIIGEWDWWETPSGNVLHSASMAYDPHPPYCGVGGNGITACGRTAELWIPGIASRLALHRCTRCHRALGYPEGWGSPKNSEECRPLVEKRLAGNG
jgi:hypothetical protein